MAVWLVRRLAASIAIVFTVITLTFFIVHLARGSPCGLGQEHPLPPEVCDSLRQRFGLDEPLWVQYVLYLRQLARGDLGDSLTQNRHVADALADALPLTFTLALAALLIDFSLGLALGFIKRHGSAGSSTLASGTSPCSSTRCRRSGSGSCCCWCSRSGSVGSPSGARSTRSSVLGSTRLTAC